MRPTDQTYASFRLLGDELDPGEVTRRLRVRPDFAGMKGEPSARLQRPLPTGSWSISSRDAVDQRDVDLTGHLQFLLERLLPVADEIRALCEERGLTADFYCFWMTEWDQGGPEPVPASVLTDIGRVGAALAFDIYPQPGDASAR
jgi:hypothetical protein